MSEVISKKKMDQILSPRNTDEKQKRQFVKDMASRKVDIKDRYKS